MEISATLQPKGLLPHDFSMTIYNPTDSKLDTVKVLEQPYILKIMCVQPDNIQLDHLVSIRKTIYDRSDIAFYWPGEIPEGMDNERIFEVNFLSDWPDLVKDQDIFLVDMDNQIVQYYQMNNSESIYGKLLEHISYVLPMIDLRIEQKEEAHEKEPGTK